MPEGGSTFRRWLPTILWALLIFVACSIPSPTVAKEVLFLDKADKAAHLILFAVLSLLLARSLAPSSARKRIVLLAAGLSLFYGLLIELYQSFIPYRFFEYLDLLADALGAGSGGLLWLKLERKKI